MRKLDGRIKGRSNKSFDRSGISLDVIENLGAIQGFFPPGQFERWAAPHSAHSCLECDVARKAEAQIEGSRRKCGPTTH
jgi:hypothetical protein